MPKFIFKAVNSQNNEVSDEIEAASIEDASKIIKSKGYFPTEIKPKDQPATTSGAGREGRKKSWAIGGVNSKILAQFTTQLSILIDAGLPIVRCLQILEQQQKPSVLKNILMDVTDDVESGSSLSDALSRHPRVFTPLFVNMVRAGEAGGVLDIILDRLSQFLERAEKIRSTVKGAMIYPIVIACVAAMILFGLMLFVVPQFQGIFEQMDVPLPSVTQIVIEASGLMMAMVGIERDASGDVVFISTNLLIDLVLVGIVFGLVVFVKKNSSGRKVMDYLKLHIPLIGPVMRKSMVTRFCRTLGTLIASNVSLLDALKICRGALGNKVLAEAIDRVHDSIREGESIADPLRASGVFDEIVVNMVAVGEETGELDKMLLKIADAYEEEVEVAVSAMTKMMEPLFIVIMGAGVGFVVISLFLPLITMISNLGNENK